MMKLVSVCIAFTLLLGSIATDCWASQPVDLPPWGISKHHIPNSQILRTEADSCYVTMPSSAEQQNVTYEFYKNRLLAVHLEIAGAKNCEQTLALLRQQYGQGHTDHRFFRNILWSTEDTIIQFYQLQHRPVAFVSYLSKVQLSEQYSDEE